MGKFSGSKHDKKFIGSYENGLKNGIWNYTINYTDYPMSTNGNKTVYTTGIISLRINYKNGYPTGSCTYGCDLKLRDIYKIRGKLNYGIFKDLKHTLININYEKGLIVGPINMSSYENDLDFNIKRDELVIKGQFDKKGNVDGKWQFVFIDGDIGGNGKVELNAEYKSGWRIKNILRKFTTGKVIDAMELETKHIQMVNEIISQNIPQSDLPKKFNYNAVTGNIFYNFPIIFNTIFNDKDFLYSYIDGDKELEIEKYDVKYTPNGGDFYVLKDIE